MGRLSGPLDFIELSVAQLYLVRERTLVTEEVVEWLAPPGAPVSQRGLRQ